MQLRHKFICAAALIAALVATSFTNVSAAAPKVGSTCKKAGSFFDTPNARFSCNKEGKKLVWRIWNPGASQNTSTAPAPTQSTAPTTSTAVQQDAPPTMQKISLPSFVSLAQSAMSNSENGIPQVDTSNTVKTSAASKNNLANFIPAATAHKFSIFGPTPIAETGSNHAGALSMITADQRGVYKSQNALPPWAVGFKLTTKDSQGRFSVATSGTGDPNQPYAWRLAYKSGSGPWKYQNIAGNSHSSNGQKNIDEIALGAPGDYSIRLEFLAFTTFYGLGLNDNAASVTPLLSGQALRVAILGDSWVAPSFNESGPVHDWDGYPGALSWLTGWNVISAGVRGQGYLQPAGNETYKDRIVRDLVPQNPSVIIFTGSSNDHLFPDKQIADEMGKDILALQKAAPNILIIVCSPYETGGDQKAPGQSKAMQAVAKTLGIPYIDFITLPLFDQSNNGQNQFANGHPTRAGSAYIAAELLKRIAGLL
jgi:lysophospholipase L1-like esterase